MKDFDTDRAGRAEVEQGFKIGGEQFRVVAGVHPSVFQSYEDAIFEGREDMLGAMDTAIRAFLATDDDRERWDKLRGRITDPLTVGDLRGVIQYLYEVEAEVPTSAPAPSSSGRARTSRSSAVATSSPAETAT